MKRKKLYSLLSRLMLLLFVAATIVLLLSARRSKEGKLCNDLQISITDESKKGFVDQALIRRQIGESLTGPLKKTPIQQFDLKKLEANLEDNIWIREAQLYFDNNEKLYVKIEQRIPIARVFETSGKSYYLDSAFFQLPLSQEAHAEVPVFTGVPVKKSKILQKTILEIAEAILADSFWMAQAAQIDLSANERFELYPTLGNHVVDLGDGKQIKEKLARLKLFYQQVLSHQGFDTYRTVSVAYNRQVVGVRRDSAAVRPDPVKAVRVFEQIVKTNRRKANEDANAEPRKTKPVVGGTIYTNENRIDAKMNDEKLKPENKTQESPYSEETKPVPKAVMPKKNNN